MNANMEKTTLWCVNIQGPDDVVPVADYLTAVKVANAFNAWWQERTAKEGLHPYDPRMWALPIEYPYDAEYHAASVANPSNSEYVGFISQATS